MDNSNELGHNDGHLKGLSDPAFHVYLWFVLALTLVGNSVVVIWRCTRPASQRRSALSIIVVNLALVDFLCGFHLLLIESVLVTSVFESNSDHLGSNKSAVDDTLCYAAYFLSCLSSTAQSVALASIAAYALLSLLSFPFQSVARKVVVAGGITIQWVLSLTLSSFTTFDSDREVPWNMSNVTEQPAVVRVYYVFTQCSFSGSLDPSIMPIATTGLCLIGLTTILQIAFIVIILRDLYLKRLRKDPGETTFLMIRLCVILTVNIFCYGPPTVAYYFGKKSMTSVLSLLRDEYCRTITEVTVILLSIPPALNPLIYTIATKPFMRVLRKLCPATDKEARSKSEISETTSLFTEQPSPHMTGCSILNVDSQEKGECVEDSIVISDGKTET